MPLPPSFLDELRNRLPLSEVIGRAVPLTRAGREFKACCPFHNEKSPSFYVNDQKAFFHCFGCGAHGDIIGFTMRHQRLSFPEAIEALASQAGMEVPRLSREDVEKEAQRKTLHQLLEAACAFFEAQLAKPVGRNAMDYLSSRAVGGETISKFRLGYAPNDASLIAHLKTQGFEETQIMEVGLARRSEDGGRVYSFFRDRLIFPVADRRGRVVAFGARLLQGEGPKYINSPDHPLFHKGKLLYSLSRAREAAPRGAPVVVMEGYMDVIRSIEGGFGAAVAPLGTALTEDQMMEVWRLGNAGGAPILCFDGDNAGQRAAARAVERLLPHLGPDRTARIAFMPQGEDPDSLIRKAGPKALGSVLEQAISLFDMVWKLESQERNFESPEARAGLEAAFEGRIAQILDSKVQNHYRQALRDRLDAEFGWKSRKNKNVTVNKGGKKGGMLHRPAVAQETRQKLVLTAMINHPQLFSQMGEWLSSHSFVAELDKVRQAVVHTLETEPELTQEVLRQRLAASGFDDVLDQLLSVGTYSLHPWVRPTAEASDALRGLKGVLAAEELDTVRTELSGARQRLAQNTDEGELARMAALRREIEGARAATMPDDPPQSE